MPAGLEKGEIGWGGILSPPESPTIPDAYCLVLSGESSTCQYSSASVCTTLFFDYVPGSSLAEAISYFLLPFPERGL